MLKIVIFLLTVLISAALGGGASSLRELPVGDSLFQELRRQVGDSSLQEMPRPVGDTSLQEIPRPAGDPSLQELSRPVGESSAESDDEEILIEDITESYTESAEILAG